MGAAWFTCARAAVEVVEKPLASETESLVAALVPIVRAQLVDCVRADLKHVLESALAAATAAKEPGQVEIYKTMLAWFNVYMSTHPTTDAPPPPPSQPPTAVPNVVVVADAATSMTPPPVAAITPRTPPPMLRSRMARSRIDVDG